MGVYEECRHYLLRTTTGSEAIQRCRVSANQESPFACPTDCLFKESRTLSGAGWSQGPSERMTNTADGLHGLPEQKRKKPRRRR